MKMNRKQIVLTAIVAIAGVGWFAVREYRCKQRGAALTRELEILKRDSAKDLKVGTNKDEVVRFFSDHHIPFKILESEAFGVLRLDGCAPLGCFTDDGFIGVHVPLDGAGVVAETPKVFHLYQDCL